MALILLSLEPSLDIGALYLASKFSDFHTTMNFSGNIFVQLLHGFGVGKSSFRALAKRVLFDWIIYCVQSKQDQQHVFLGPTCVLKKLLRRDLKSLRQNFGPRHQYSALCIPACREHSFFCC